MSTTPTDELDAAVVRAIEEQDGGAPLLPGRPARLSAGVPQPAALHDLALLVDGLVRRVDELEFAKRDERERFVMELLRSQVEALNTMTDKEVEDKRLLLVPNSPAIKDAVVYHWYKPCADDNMGCQTLRSWHTEDFARCEYCDSGERDLVFVLGDLAHEDPDCEWKYARCSAPLSEVVGKREPCPWCAVAWKKQQFVRPVE